MNIHALGHRLYRVLLLCLLFIGLAHAGTLDPRLAALTAGKSATASSVAANPSQPLDPFAPRLDSAGRVQVYIFPLNRNAPLPGEPEITALGGTKIVVSASLHVVQAWVPVSALNALAVLPDVGRVTVPTYAKTPRPIGPVTRPSLESYSPPRVLPRGVPSGLAIDADAVQAMQAIQLQAVGALGTGIKVGVISGDNSGLAASQAAGYLPSTVFCVATSNCNTPTPGDPAEGTAMLEEVHAMTPNASLGFCGPNTTVDFLNCYTDLISWGANVIVDDLGFPVDQFTVGATADGSFAAAAAQITQAHPDIAFVSSAGNNAQDYFQALYTATASSCTIGGTIYTSCMDFGKAVGLPSGNELQITLSPNEVITPDLFWNDLANSSADALVLYLLDVNGNVLATGTPDTTDAGRPDQVLSYTAGASQETDYLLVACQTCSDPITIKLEGNGDGAYQFYSTPGSIDAGQKVAVGVMTTVAGGVTSQNPPVVNMEAFSGVGPFLYGNYTGTSTLAKPDLTGIDGVTVSGAGGFSSNRQLPNGGVAFCGTSATSPNIGSLIAALMSADPGQPASFYYTALENSANQIAIGTTPFNGCGTPTNTGYTSAGAGAGLAQGFAALQSFFTFPSTSITAPVVVTGGMNGNYTVPTNLAIDFTAAVQAGTNQVSSSNCQWLATLLGQTTGTSLTGTTVAFTFPSVTTYTVVADCPDNRGILAPAPFTNITINAQSIPAPTVAVSNVASTSFNVTLTGHEPLTITTTSSNSAVLPNTGIMVSSGCGTTALSCSVSLSPAIHANGSATITVKATDQYGQNGTGNAQVSYTYTPPSSGGGGGLGAFSLMALLICLRLKARAV